ncbi:MAG TPA: helix-turn-helix domain-containing protein, partial [Acidimicrobiales bacterium]|nr:helix-turn-helix domain-containing protein [Acidimicrobiales bacterium]
MAEEKPPALDPSVEAVEITVSNPNYWASEREALRLGVEEALFGLPEPERGIAVSMPPRLTLTVEEAAATLGISRAFAYEAVRRGDIPSIRIGRRVLVPQAALSRMLGVT